VSRIEDVGELISVDVLIVGGGIGGLVAAIKAKEESSNANVLIVEKQTVGWAGKASKGAGGIWVMLPGDDPEKFVAYHVRNIGHYLNDQKLMYSFANGTYSALEQLEGWGVRIPRGSDRKLDAVKWRSPHWSWTGVDLDMLFPLRKTALKHGVKTLNKIQLVDLLKQDDRVVGAVGFNLIDGRFYIFRAKAIILANGSCNYRVMRMWASGFGDGIAAAYRAGAEMRNAEYGNFYEIIFKGTNSLAYMGHEFLFNSLDENITKRYMPEELPDIPPKLLMGMERETIEGRGPLSVDLPQLLKRYEQIPFQQGRPHLEAFYGRTEAKVRKYGPPASPRPEVMPSFLGELGPIKVDHDMKTTLMGLWAIGDASYGGSTWTGAISVPGGIRGSGLMNAILSALRAGPSATRFAAEAVSPEVAGNDVKPFKDRILAPLRRDKGVLAREAMDAIQDVVCPIKYSLRRSKGRLEEALSRIEEIQRRLLELCAKDGHGLGKCHEARAMAICAEITLRSALMRTESRGWHYREDYPKRDDKNWLKWVIARQEGGKMILSTEAVPIDQYKIKP
jgi:succinate dehydrogenase/fumarate reductase flavoprotein subunit